MFEEPKETDENHDRVLEVFNRHPARALSARELGVILDEDRSVCEGYLEDLEDAGFVYQTVEKDGEHIRYRVVND